MCFHFINVTNCNVVQNASFNFFILLKNLFIILKIGKLVKNTVCFPVPAKSKCIESTLNFANITFSLSNKGLGYDYYSIPKTLLGALHLSVFIVLQIKPI